MNQVILITMPSVLNIMKHEIIPPNELLEHDQSYNWHVFHKPRFLTFDFIKLQPIKWTSHLRKKCPFVWNKFMRISQHWQLGDDCFWFSGCGFVDDAKMSHCWWRKLISFTPEMWKNRIGGFILRLLSI